MRNAVNSSMDMHLPFFQHSFETFQWLLEQQTPADSQDVAGYESAVWFSKFVLVTTLNESVHRKNMQQKD